MQFGFVSNFQRHSYECLEWGALYRWPFSFHGTSWETYAYDVADRCALFGVTSDCILDVSAHYQQKII